MKSIMEETKVVQTLTILLYSQVFDSQSKNLMLKQEVFTSKHVDIPLGLPLKQVQIFIKKNQQNMQILDSFRFCLQDFSSNSTVEQLQNYIKLKKRFGQYSLLFQIFYRYRSTINSMMDVEKKVRLSEEERKLQQENQIKEITRANLFLLGFRVANNYHKYHSKKKISLPSDEALEQRKNKARKLKKTKSFNPAMYKLKKQNLKSNKFMPDQGQAHMVRSSKDFCKAKSQENEFFCSNFQCVLFKKPSDVSFIKRSPKKNVTYEENKSSIIKKRGDRKKITFLDEKTSINEYCYNESPAQSNKNSVIREKIEETCTDIPLTVFDQSKGSGIKQKLNQKPNATSIRPQSNQIKVKLTNQPKDKPIINQSPENFRTVPIKSQNLYENLRELCQQRQSQRMCRTKRTVSKPKLMISSLQNSKLFFHRKSKPQGQNKQNFIYVTNYLNPDSHENFYQNLYAKTIKSIQRQGKILNYVKSHCQTMDLMSPKRQNSRSKEIFVKIPNLKQLQKEHKIQLEKTKAEQEMKLFKLKKKKAEEQYLVKLRSRTSNRKLVRG